MAITKNTIQVQWTGPAVTQSINAGNAATSLAFAFSEAMFDAWVTMRASNNGTPASGDVVDFYLLSTAGDVDADPDVADDFDTGEQGVYLGTADTVANQPAQISAPLPSSAIKGGKIYAVNRSAGRAITVSVQIRESLG